MPAPSWEDLTEFFDDDSDGGFAVVAELELADGKKRQINVIYDEPFSRTSFPGGGGSDSAAYCFTAPETDIEGLKKQCAVNVAGNTLYVISIESDGTGVSRVYLEHYLKSSLDRYGGRL